MKILTANAAAANNQIKLSRPNRQFLQLYARKTASGYCNGCADICESAVNNQIPISDIMRYLMYSRSYGEPDRASALFNRLPLRVRARLAGLDYSMAEQKCPQKIQIGYLMQEAAGELA